MALSDLDLKWLRLMNRDYGANAMNNPLYARMYAEANPSHGSSSSSAPGASAPGASTPGTPFTWSFPQYSQTWAFTPPAPSKFNLPGPFSAPSSKTDSKTASTPFSVTDLMAKYK
jgi:hypothetical protein